MLNLCRQPHVGTFSRRHALRIPSAISCSSRAPMLSRTDVPVLPAPMARRRLPSGFTLGRKAAQQGVVCRLTPEGGQGPTEREEGPLDGAMPAFSRWWDCLTAQQKAYTVVAVASLMYLLPKAFIFFVVSLERMFIGLLMEVEEVVVQLLFRTTALGLTVGLALLFCAGIYVVLAPPEKKQ